MGLLDQMIANIYKPAKQEKTATILPKHLTPAKVANMAAQATVSQGQLLRGEVLDLRANQILVLLENGATVSARTDGTLELSIGQNAKFLVAQTTEEQILLKHVKEQDANENPMIDKALSAAGITKTERSTAIVTELLAHQQPVNEGSIRHYLSLSAKYPELPVKNLILMELHRIPVTKENVAQFTAYHKQSQPLLTQAKELINSVLTALGQLPEGETKEMLTKEFACLFPEVNPSPERPDTQPPAPSVPSWELPDAKLPASSTPSTELPDAKLPASSTPSTELPDAKPPAPSAENPAVAEKSEVLPPKESPAEPLLKNFPDSFLLQPKDLSDPEKVRKFYHELDEKLEQLEQLSAKISEASGEPSLETPKQMRSHLSFMDAVGQVFPYVQLPLKFRETPCHGELYVYEKKRNLKPTDTLSALLHLELEALGTTDIFITLSGTHVTARFSMTNEESKELICRELPSLTKALSAKGYILTSDVSVRQEDTEQTAPSLLEQFLEEHAPGGLNRYTFDIRA